MPSAELIQQQPLLWGAETQQLLLGMCIPMGSSRQALAQLAVAFRTDGSARQGRVCPACGQPHSLPVLGTHFRADILPVMGGGTERVGCRLGVGGAPMAPTDASGRAPAVRQAALPLHCSHGCALLPLPSPLWASALESLQG